MVFESGFSGFIGLTITTPVWVGRLLLNGSFISKPLAAALRSGEKEEGSLILCAQQRVVLNQDFQD